MATNKSGGGAVSWSERLARQQVWNAQSSVPDSFPLPPLIEFCASTSSEKAFEGEAERLAFVSEDKSVRVAGPFIQFDDTNKMVYVNDGRSTASTITGRTCGRLIATSLKEDEPIPHYCCLSVYENRTLFAFVECKNKQFGRSDYELAKAGATCFLDYLEKVHTTAATTHEGIRFLERAFLVAQERVRERMVSADDGLLLTGGILTQLDKKERKKEQGDHLKSMFEQPKSSSNNNHNNHTKSKQDWAFLSVSMPGGPTPILLNPSSPPSATTPFPPLLHSNPTPFISLSSFSLNQLCRTITPCCGGDNIVITNSEFLSLLDPVFLGKSPKMYFSSENFKNWGDIPEKMNPEKVRQESVLSSFGTGWNRCHRNLNDFPEYLMHKVVSSYKTQKDGSGSKKSKGESNVPFPPHHLCCAFRASFAHLSPPPPHSVLPLPQKQGVVGGGRGGTGGVSRGVRWEACRIEPTETKGFKNVEQALQLLLMESVTLENVMRRQDIQEFYWVLGSPSIEMRVRRGEGRRKGEKKGKAGDEVFMLGMRGLVRCMNATGLVGEGGAGAGVEGGVENKLFGWAGGEGEMVLMDWQSEPFLSAAVLKALREENCGISEKKAKQVVKDNFASFSPKKDLVEVVGERKKLEVNEISSAFGVASGDLEITETTFEVFLDKKSKGNFYSLSISSTKPHYLSEFSQHLFHSLDISSPNTSLLHFLTSLKESGKKGKEGKGGEKGGKSSVLDVLVMESEEEEEEGFERSLEDVEVEEGEIMIGDIPQS